MIADTLKAILVVGSGSFLYGPWGRWGINQQESVAGLSGHSLLTALFINSDHSEADI